MKRLALLLAVLAITACDEGESVVFPEPPAGPAGPTGPTGPQGPPGPAGAVRVDTVWRERIVYVNQPATAKGHTCNMLDPNNLAHIPTHWFYHPFPVDSLRVFCRTVS